MCMCLWSRHSTDVKTLADKDIGVVLDRPQRQWAKFKVNEQKSRKLNMLYVWKMWNAKVLPCVGALSYWALTSPGVSV